LNRFKRLLYLFRLKKSEKADSRKCLSSIDNNLKKAFHKIKSELNDHKESINQNTNEIQGNYEYMCRIDSRLDKLSERIDELSLFIQQLTGTESEENKFTVSALTTKEQEVFMAIYMHDDEATYRDIGRKTGLTENLVLCYVTNLITKGVPIIKRYSGSEIKITIDTEFKKLQTKQNVLRINESVSQAVMV